MLSAAKIFKISKVSISLWKREFFRMAGAVAPHKEKYLIFFLLGILLVYSSLLIFISYTSISIGVLPDELASSALRSSLGGIFAASGLISIIIFMATGSAGSFSKTVALLPVKEYEKLVGENLHVIFINFFITTLLSIPSLFIVYDVFNEKSYLPFVLVGILIYIFYCIFLSTLFINLINNLARTLNLSNNYCRFISSVVCIFIIILSLFPDNIMMNYETSNKPAIFTPMVNRVFSDLFLGRSFFVSLLVLFSYISILLLLTVVTSRSSGSSLTESNFIFKKTPYVNKYPIFSLFLINLVRSPQFSMLLFSGLFFVLSKPLLQKYGEIANSIGETISNLAPMALASLALFSFGLVREKLWLVSHLKTTRNSWISPQILGAISISLSFSVAIITISYVFNIWEDPAILEILLKTTLVTIISLVAGTLFPTSKHLGLSNIFSGFLMIVIFGSISMLHALISLPNAASVLYWLTWIMISLIAYLHLSNQISNENSIR